MAYVLSLLPFLLCPLSMGLMMWLMRDRRPVDSPTHVVEPLPAPARPAVAQSRAARLGSLLHLCVDWRVAAALAVVGGGVWLVAPALIWAALPLLVVAICPLSMLLMMRQHHSAGTQQRIVEHAADLSQPASAPPRV